METGHRTVLGVVALLWLVSFPASAAAGYDIAHIVERTCEPGGPLIVADEWKRPRDRDRVVTEPGEVIACPPAGGKSSFQIAAGPERIGPELYVCTYFSLSNGDGADTCLGPDPKERTRSSVKPLMAMQADRSNRLALAGIVSADVAAVAVTADAEPSRDSIVIPIERERAVRLGATGAFGYFSLTVDRRTLCSDGPPRLLGRDSSGRPIARSPVQVSTLLLSVTDRVPYGRSLKARCGSRRASESMALDWLSGIRTALRSLFAALI